MKSKQKNSEEVFNVSFKADLETKIALDRLVAAALSSTKAKAVKSTVIRQAIVDAAARLKPIG